MQIAAVRTLPSRTKPLRATSVLSPRKRASSPRKDSASRFRFDAGGDLRVRGVLAPIPTTAKEDVTSDPSPCPLPEGEGSPRAHFQVPTRSFQTLARVTSKLE